MLPAAVPASIRFHGITASKMIGIPMITLSYAGPAGGAFDHVVAGHDRAVRTQDHL